MSKLVHKILLISDFNIQNFANVLGSDTSLPEIETIVAPFNHVMPTLLQRNGDAWKECPDYCIVWTQPESVIPSFRSFLEYTPAPLDKVLEEVAEYASLLVNVSKKVRAVFAPSWVVPTYHQGLGMIDLREGIAGALMEMNLRLSSDLRKASNIYLLNTQKWIEAVGGKKAFNPKLWYMGKIAFGNEVYLEAMQDLKSALRGMQGEAKKLIIVDLDDTLWGGIVGDIGWENLRLGGHDHVGEAFSDFQRQLKVLKNRGVLLGIVSKNESSVALEAIRRHPEMVLNLDDFSGWRIDWTDKAENILDLVNELNIGLQSVVFIDDNPVEQDRVRQALPEVFVPAWPKDKMLYAATLLGLKCFNTPSISSEDLGRTQMYVSERRRKKLKKTVGSLDEWFRDLNTVARIERLGEHNLQRATQLFNKTNQLNLSTRRLTENELLDWARREENRLWTFRVSDRFGDSGLVGIVSLQVKNHDAQIIDLILSCRVMGRRIEETMLHVAIQHARKLNLNAVHIEYLATTKNKPCFGLLAKIMPTSGRSDHHFTWDLDTVFHLPEFITIHH